MMTFLQGVSRFLWTRFFFLSSISLSPADKHALYGNPLALYNVNILSIYIIPHENVKIIVIYCGGLNT